MKFSVLLSVYAKEKPDYLVDCLNSLLCQTRVPDEIVLIQDGPLTPALYRVIHEYLKNYPQLLRTFSFEENRGLGPCLADGVKLCRYDLIARMDTDDISIYNRFEKQLRFFEQHPDVDIVGSYLMEYSEDMKTPLSLKEIPLTDGEIKTYLRRRCPFNHMTVMFKREAVLKAGNYRAFHANEDYDLWGRMALSGAMMANIPEVLIKMRTGDKMFKRRGGLAYVVKEIQLQHSFYHHKLTNFWEYITNCIIRMIVGIVPNPIRQAFYRRHLRKNVEEIPVTPIRVEE